MAKLKYMCKKGAAKRPRVKKEKVSKKYIAAKKKL